MRGWLLRRIVLLLLQVLRVRLRQRRRRDSALWLREALWRRHAWGHHHWGGVT